MKPYRERLPEIDKAIFELGGELEGNYLIYPINGNEHKPFCAETLNQKGVSSITGRKTDSNSTIYRCVTESWDYIDIEKAQSRLADWRRLYGAGEFVIAFDEWLGSCEHRELSLRIASVTDFHWQKSLEEDMEESSWYEIGELPPVGTECRYDCAHELNYGLDRCTFVGFNKQGRVVIQDLEGVYRSYPKDTLRFWPLQSERDKLLERVEELIYALIICGSSSETITKFLYEQGFLKETTKGDS